MQILLPIDIKSTLVAEVRKAGKRESGGLLLGEHVGENLFKVVGATVQKVRGTNAHFERDPEQHATQLEEFFQNHGDNCSRFNYLGEWHSHPSFDVHPSGQDLLSMGNLVADTSVGVNFAVLMIVRLMRSGDLAISITFCLSQDQFIPGRLFVEAESFAPQKRFRLL